MPNLVIGICVGVMLATILHSVLHDREEIEEIQVEAQPSGTALVGEVNLQTMKRTSRNVVVKGAIFMPETEYDLARERLLQKNKELGVDTPISDLI